jgi:hypothetical protein
MRMAGMSRRGGGDGGTLPPEVFCKDVILKGLSDESVQECDSKGVAGAAWNRNFLRADSKWVAARGGVGGRVSIET